MDIVINLLFWIHLAALGLGGAAAFGMPVIGAQMGAATPEMRPVLGRIAQRLSTMGRAGFGLLIITGPILFWLKWNFSATSQMWFGIKMLVVLVLLGIVIFAGINGKKAMSGDSAAAARAPQIGMASMVAFLLVILSAVFAFG